jgi:hypothetical protein
MGETVGRSAGSQSRLAINRHREFLAVEQAPEGALEWLWRCGYGAINKLSWGRACWGINTAGYPTSEEEKIVKFRGLSSEALEIATPLRPS